MKFAGRVVLTLLLVLGLAVGGVWGASVLKMNRAIRVQARALALPADSAALARGHTLATAIGKCQECHGQDYGGTVFIKDKVFGTFVAPNLTQGAGSPVASFTPAMWDAAIRHGVRPDGRMLAYMPSEAYQYLTDQDLMALVAYLRSLPPVNRPMADTTDVGPLGRALYVAGKVPLFAAEAVRHDSVGVRTQPLGEYLAYTGGCHACHGERLAGGRIPVGPPTAPPAPNIGATGMPGWSEADFIKVLRTGIRPDGTTLDPFMPWALTGELGDGDLGALYRYLRTVS